MIFIVGGALGLSETILSRCPWKLSLSPMTFPHPMVRLILAEQLYRAIKINRGERVVIIEFPSAEAAMKTHDGPAYQEALRALGDSAERDFRIIEGV